MGPHPERDREPSFRGESGANHRLHDRGNGARLRRPRQSSQNVNLPDQLLKGKLFDCTCPRLTVFCGLLHFQARQARSSCGKKWLTLNVLTAASGHSSRRRPGRTPSGTLLPIQCLGRPHVILGGAGGPLLPEGLPVELRSNSFRHLACARDAGQGPCGPRSRRKPWPGRRRMTRRRTSHDS